MASLICWMGQGVFVAFLARGHTRPSNGFNRLAVGERLVTRGALPGQRAAAGLAGPAAQQHSSQPTRARSALTQPVKVVVRRQVNIHAVYLAEESGQLPFLGSIHQHLHHRVVECELQLLICRHVGLLDEEHEDQILLGVDAKVGVVAAAPTLSTGRADEA